MKTDKNVPWALAQWGFERKLEERAYTFGIFDMNYCINEIGNWVSESQKIDDNIISNILLKKQKKN